jgi:hypothetical protein
LATARFDARPPDDLDGHLAQLGVAVERRPPAKEFVRSVRKPQNVVPGRPTAHFTLSGVPVTMLMTRHNQPGRPDRLAALCVRTCDGFYFPISFSTSRARFKIDEAVCKAMYGGADAELYVHYNGSPSEQAVSLSGKRYLDLPTALLYRSEFNRSCQAQLHAGLKAIAAAQEVALAAAEAAQSAISWRKDSRSIAASLSEPGVERRDSSFCKEVNHRRTGSSFAGEATTTEISMAARMARHTTGSDLKSFPFTSGPVTGSLLSPRPSSLAALARPKKPACRSQHQSARPCDLSHQRGNCRSSPEHPFRLRSQRSISSPFIYAGVNSQLGL